MDIPQCVADADEAIAVIKTYHAKWQQGLPQQRTAKKAARKTKSRNK
jgi:hypothetical protein